MASMKYHKDVKRWRVFWHVTMPNGEVDKGSKSFKDKETAKKFKLHCEKKTTKLKRTAFVENVFLDEVFSEWKTFCLGYTERTREHYISEVTKFVESLSEEVVYISDLTTLDINNYLNSMLSRGLANKTVNNVLCAIKSLCRYIAANYKITNPAIDIKKLKEDPAVANFWSLEEYQEVLKHSSDFTKRLIRFISCTGLRATEFCNLRWQNCDIKNKTITIIGKGRKKRTIGLNDTALAILNDIKVSRKVRAGEPIFLDKKNEAMTRYDLYDFINEPCRNSGLKGGVSIPLFLNICNWRV